MGGGKAGPWHGRRPASACGGRQAPLAVLSQTSQPVWFPFPAEMSKGCLLPNPLPQRGPPLPKDPRAAGWGGEGSSEGQRPAWDFSPAGRTSRATLCTVCGPLAASTTQLYSPASSSRRSTICTWSRPLPRSVRDTRLCPGALRSTAEDTKGWQPSGKTWHHTFRALMSWGR